MLVCAEGRIFPKEDSRDGVESAKREEKMGRDKSLWERGEKEKEVGNVPDQEKKCIKYTVNF